ncbi:MAG TPA: hypothetical protein VNM22_16355 [Candidatus Limnocylindrales bacterium]|nr:hypothetical protein [Candidatus Limnocylindrales bacterium]
MTFLLLTLGILQSVLLQIPFSQRVLVDKIVAIVQNTDIITWSELREAANSKSLGFLLDLQGTPDEKKVLEYLIENRLILHEIGYLSHRNVEPIELEVALRWIIKAYIQPGHSLLTREEFQKALEEKGISTQELKQLLEPQLRGIEYIRRKNRFTADIQDPEKVLELFENWIEELKKQGEIQYPE